MTLKEFVEQNPQLIEEAGKCKTIDEFKKFAKDIGIEIADEGLKAAYSYVKALAGGELEEDVLEGVAGGKVLNIDIVGTKNMRVDPDGIRFYYKGDWKLLKGNFSYNSSTDTYTAALDI